MPQPEDYLGAFVILALVATLGCGVAVITLIAAVDHFCTKLKRRHLRNARR